MIQIMYSVLVLLTLLSYYHFIEKLIKIIPYVSSNGAVLVYDITDEDSFVKVKNWVRELRKVLGDNIELCIAGLYSN